MKSFFAELKRRNVYKVAVAYAIIGWLLVQVTRQVFHFSKFRTGPSAAFALLILLAGASEIDCAAKQMSL
jgi:hypothetical protein